MKLIALLVLGLVVYAGWKHFNTAPPASLVAAVDPSGSILRNCPGLRQEMEAALTKPGVSGGSRVTVLMMGTGPVDNQPRRVFEGPVPTAAGAYQAGQSNAARNALLGGIESACADAPESASSPVYALVKRAVAEAKAGSGKNRGYVIVKSDGVDNAEPQLRRLMTRTGASPGTHVPVSLAGSIDNEGVNVTFCGSAEIQPRREGRDFPPQPEAIALIWRGLFTRPDEVRFEAYCGHAAPERHE